jgi:hypothetical protein
MDKGSIIALKWLCKDVTDITVAEQNLPKNLKKLKTLELHLMKQLLYP